MKARPACVVLLVAFCQERSNKRKPAKIGSAPLGAVRLMRNNTRSLEGEGVLMLQCNIFIMKEEGKRSGVLSKTFFFKAERTK